MGGKYTRRYTELGEEKETYSNAKETYVYTKEANIENFYAWPLCAHTKIHRDWRGQAQRCAESERFAEIGEETYVYTKETN